jgi:hypothetical protein
LRTSKATVSPLEPKYKFKEAGLNPNLPHNINEGTADKQLIQGTLNEVLFVLNGNIEFGNPTDGISNINGVWLTAVTPGVVDTNFTLSHNLGYIPTGWLVVNIDKAAILYKGATPWSTTQLTLKCNVATTAIVIFVF